MSQELTHIVKGCAVLKHSHCERVTETMRPTIVNHFLRLDYLSVAVPFLLLNYRRLPDGFHSLIDGLFHLRVVIGKSPGVTERKLFAHPLALDDGLLKLGLDPD